MLAAALDHKRKSDPNGFKRITKRERINIRFAFTQLFKIDHPFNGHLCRARKIILRPVEAFAGGAALRGAQGWTPLFEFVPSFIPTERRLHDTSRFRDDGERSCAIRRGKSRSRLADVGLHIAADAQAGRRC